MGRLVSGIGRGIGNLLGGGTSRKVDAEKDRLDQRNNYLFDTVNSRVGPMRERDDEIFNSTMDIFGDVRNNLSNYQSGPGYQAVANYQNAPGYQLLQGYKDNPAYKGFEEMSKSGGWSPRDRGDVERNINSFRDLANFGRGWTEDGGMSEGDRANFRARGTSNVDSFYSNLKDTLGRQNRVQGGINPGYTSQMSKLARDRSRESQAAVTDTETQLAEMIRQGKVAGADIWGSATGQANDARMGMMNSINSGRLSALGGLSDLDRWAASGMADMDRWGAGTLAELDDRNIGNTMELARALGSMYGNERDFLQMLLGQSNTEAGQNSNWFGIRQNQDDRFWRRLQDLMGAGAAAGGAMMGGGGGAGRLQGYEGILAG